MTRIVFMTPDDLPHGFASAGFEQVLTNSAAALEKLQQTIEEPEVGVIVVDERLLTQIDDEEMQRLHDQWSGILLVLPTPVGAAAVEEDYLQKLIRRALGYHVRIRE